MGIAGDGRDEGVSEPSKRAVVAAIGIALAFVAVTRWPFARAVPLETDEWLFVWQMGRSWFPIHHTLFQTAGRLVGLIVGDNYRGLVVLDMVVSALAMVSVWWWLRALVRPATAAAAAMVVAVAPLFWSLGEMAGNYTMIPLVGSFLMGVAYRGGHAPKPWHPYAAAVVLAIGTGYREDIGVYWLPVLGVIVWQHRWRPAVGALALFTLLNLAWLVPMLAGVGGLESYRSQSAEFAESAGYRNSVWNLGMVDAPVRYAVKMALAVLWTLGPGLIFVPRGMKRLGSIPNGRLLAALLILSILPPLAFHLLIHFGVAGYSFHYLPALVALLAVGIGQATAPAGVTSADRAPFRLAALAVMLAAVFLLYPADFARPGWRGDFDLAVARYSRVGLQASTTDRAPATWRTSNSSPRSQATRSTSLGIRAN